MAMTQTAAATKSFSYTDGGGNEFTMVATFNGKIYNGKRYINVGAAGRTQTSVIWQDGIGWTDRRFDRFGWSDQVVELFGLE